MVASKKKVKQAVQQNRKSIPNQNASTDNKRMIWVFDRVQNNGNFRFSVEREDFNAKVVFEKLLQYSKLTWSEVRRETHDQRNKTKHHYVDIDSLTKEGQQSVKSVLSEEDYDSIFSFRLSNMERIIGLRENEKFVVMWFDPDHKFVKTK